MIATRMGRCVLVVALLALTGCPTAMSTAGTRDSDDRSESGAWPLRFKAHNVGVYCFSTYGCRITYAGRLRADDPQDTLAPESAALGDKYPKILRAGAGPIPNFPKPVEISWRAKDGTPLEASVNLDEIFKDRLIRHHLRREEIPDATLRSDHLADIIVEVNDRTVNVYTRAFISTLEQQRPGSVHSNFRDDLFKVYSHTY